MCLSCLSLRCGLSFHIDTIFLQKTASDNLKESYASVIKTALYSNPK